VVATGGSGTLASLVGVAKALQDSGTKGLGLQGCRPEEAAELTASVRPGDYFGIEWREIATLVPALARGWCGIIGGGKLEVSHRSHFGDLTLAQLPAPEYAPVWGRSEFGTSRSRCPHCLSAGGQIPGVCA
jgi:NTE family protein